MIGLVLIDWSWLLGLGGLVFGLGGLVVDTNLIDATKLDKNEMSKPWHNRHKLNARGGILLVDQKSKNNNNTVT